MAVDKLVDSAQLDADLSSVADAIRAKSGSNGSLSFPSGFADAIEAIETDGSGGSSCSDMVSAFAKKEISGDIVLDSSVKALPHTYFMSEQPITSFRGDGIGGLPSYSFANCKSLVSIHLPNLTTLYATHCFDGCSALTMACFPKLGTGSTQYTYTATFYNCSSLQSADLGTLGDTSRGRGLNNQDFYGCTNLKTLILRKNDAICALGNISCFQNSSIASGGNGCTIYIPKALYDHLGDGSSLDYKAATNWSTVDGYETITWAQIEGSIYETQYADGTPIT